MIDRLKRTAGASWLALTGAAERARRDLYGGRHGLRVINLHDVPPHYFDWFRRLLDWVGETFSIVGPEAAAEILAGRAAPPARDQVLFTFDDGFESNYAAAEHLASRGIRAAFFVVPSFLDRTVEEYLAYHRGRGVDAFTFNSHGSRGGLSRFQVREMLAMGHLVAAHNYAHRDLGKLRSAADLDYEIDQAVDAVAELTGQPCEDFAIGFGRPRNISVEAVARLQQRVQRVYACVRGLNVPGQVPRLLARDSINLDQPFIYQKACIRGGMDLRWAHEIEQLKQLGGTVASAAATHASV
jgi:peptidoglycan/xylan/chitin deacetylase (PgdA/CDA1 family)